MLQTIRVGKCLRRMYRQVAHQNTRRLSTGIDLDTIRNIGILAHIDAGKTTTTERMLYYAGMINSMGEVHHGNTVTDYMDQERERGITITAASVSFLWDDHQFNLIDTPGHIDFTMEVEQSLAVLDGAIIVLDASAGVEAQTLTVWRQTDDYRLPRIIYANKMDRKDANLGLCIKSLKDRLGIHPLCLHYPLRKEENLIGILNVVDCSVVVWATGSGRGQKYISKKLTEKDHGVIWEQIARERNILVDTLSSLDDRFAEIVIQSDSMEAVESSAIKTAIKNVNLNQTAYPLLCGSSYKNVGVQLLMDGIIDYLPSPNETKHFQSCFENNLCAKVFKIQHDDQKGVLTFLRLFQGQIETNKKLYNITRQKNEQSGAMFVAYADELKAVSNVSQGNIAVVTGLKYSNSGDLITNTHTAMTTAKKTLIKRIVDNDGDFDKVLPPAISLKIGDLTDPGMIVDLIFGLGANIPDPVFMCSIEPPSLAFQTALDTTLERLQREDPSLRVINNEETGQTVLAGMGELHLDVIKHKITNDYKLDACFGQLSISYKEMIVGEHQQKYVYNHKIGIQKQYVQIIMSARPLVGPKRDELIRLDNHPDNASNVNSIYPRYMQAIKRGAEASIMNGPKAGCPVVNADVTLHWFEIQKGTSETAVAAATTQCLKWAYKTAGTILLEPVMKLQINTTNDNTTRVLGDLTKRQSTNIQIHTSTRHAIIECLTPLSQLLGYSNDLRFISSGLATFNMEFHSNREISSEMEPEVLQNIRGF